ncbi:transposase [Uliginosibacterium paludis]|uniref:Transposase n=1 Tax=Uliginosibacterium paludis TaxID=1615952 RepID=A0ABV2CTR3_9RHOO
MSPELTSPVTLASWSAALREAITRTREKHPFTIEAWVLMPDHLHCIWTLQPGDSDFSTRWSLIKRRVSMALGERLHLEAWRSASKAKRRESTLRQRRCLEHTLRDETDFARCLDDIHFNPVKHGHVERVVDWPWSSFHRHLAVGFCAPDWAGDSSPGVFGEE